MHNDADAKVTTQCQRCGRTLRAAASITRGYGRTCALRKRQEAAIATFKPAQVAKAIELIEQGGIIPLRGKRVFQVIASNGTDRYLTAPELCNCAAGRKGHHVCYHRVAATLLAA